MTDLLPEVLAAAERYPDAPALTAGRRTLTYGALARAIRSVARSITVTLSSLWAVTKSRGRAGSARAISPLSFLAPSSIHRLIRRICSRGSGSRPSGIWGSAIGARSVSVLICWNMWLLAAEKGITSAPKSSVPAITLSHEARE